MEAAKGLEQDCSGAWPQQVQVVALPELHSLSVTRGGPGKLRKELARECEPLGTSSCPESPLFSADFAGFLLFSHPPSLLIIPPTVQPLSLPARGPGGSMSSPRLALGPPAPPPRPRIPLCVICSRAALSPQCKAFESPAWPGSSPRPLHCLEELSARRRY